MDPILAAVLDQAFFQLLWQKDRPLLAFVVNGNISPFQCLPCDKPVFTDPDAGTADCLDHQEQTAAGFRLCRQSQPVVLFFCQFLVLFAERASLYFKQLYLAVLFLNKIQKTVH